jgi:hypothetical protein
LIFFFFSFREEISWKDCVERAVWHFARMGVICAACRGVARTKAELQTLLAQTFHNLYGFFRREGSGPTPVLLVFS